MRHFMNTALKTVSICPIVSSKIPTLVDNDIYFFLGEPFAKAVGSYLQKGFQKGVPSLFQSVKHLYATPEKVRIIFFVMNLNFRSL
jgi:hypothetical protein